MYLTAQLKLLPSADQEISLARTMGAFNAACDYASGIAWDAKVFRQFDLHKLCYRGIRERFSLNAQSAIRVIAKVSDSYKLDKLTKRSFRTSGAATYDDRMVAWNIAASYVSIWSLDGRLRVPFVCGLHQRALLANRKGETDLTVAKGQYYLMATCVTPDAAQIRIAGFLGVDLGIANIAADSDGKRYSGRTLKNVRHRHRRLRARLQKKQTRAARRRLKNLAGKEARFARHINHVISKEIVASAERTGRGIAVEELTDIRDRIRVGKKQRAVLHSWAFAQLGAFLTYKAILAGVPLVAIDPRNTSRECSVCGYIDKRNRPNQSIFRCLECDHSSNADTNAARAIAGRATSKLAVNVAGSAKIGSHSLVTSRRH